jgi:hypothetical protein
MKAAVTAVVFATALLICAADVYAFSSGHHGRAGGGSGSGSGTSYSGDSTTTASVPEPSTLYALGSGLALLAGAGWYIRRRK